jgi:transcriptional regulator with XRE-family HTH domain
VLPIQATTGSVGSMSETRPAAEILRELRRRKGTSLRQAAADLDVSAGYLSRLERGEKVASGRVSERMADYYGVDGEALMLSEGRVPTDIVAILQRHPEALEQLRRQYGLAGR